MAKSTSQTATPATQTEATKTLSGYAVSLMGFIPTPKGNLRAQAELTSVMADIEEGKKPFSAIFDLIQDRDFRVQPINRRYPEAKADAMLSAANPVAETPKTEGRDNSDAKGGDVAEGDSKGFDAGDEELEGN